jgi:RNA polymerase sigma factor (sigma-70 family)
VTGAVRLGSASPGHGPGRGVSGSRRRPRPSRPARGTARRWRDVRGGCSPSCAATTALGRYEQARAAALRVTEHPQDLSVSNWGLAELIEAAVRAGTPEQAAKAHRRLVEMARVSGTEWVLGLAARSGALLTEGRRAEDLYAEATDRLARCRMAVDLARAHLLYGEWLRRERRRSDAREQLQLAHGLFSDFGMDAFAERARIELEATGEHARKRTVDTIDQLTPQESQIARLAADGNTNREIAAQLFISPSTVEYHLRKAFRKLDVKSRTQLARRLR